MNNFFNLSFGENYSLPLITITTLLTYAIYFQAYLIIQNILILIIKSYKKSGFDFSQFLIFLKETGILILTFISGYSVKNNIFPIIIFLVFFRFLVYCCNIVVDVIPKNKLTPLTFLITFLTLLITLFKNFTS